MHYYKYPLLAFLLLSLLLVGDVAYCPYAVPAVSVSGRSTVVDKSKIDPGYMLFSPYSAADNLDKPGSVYLTDLFGKMIHRWETKYQAFYALLDKNAGLYVALVPSGENADFPAGGRTGVIQKLDWSGNVLWEYKDDKLHHDFDVLPNGNVAAIVWEPLEKDAARQVKGGVAGTEYNGDMWADSIIEIDGEKNVVWSWHLGERVSPGEESLGAYTRRAELSHSNSLRYVEKNPLDGTEAYLLSVRHLNAIFLIRKNDGEIIWRSPEGMLSFQHDATLLENGNVLVFDNGVYRSTTPPRQGSAVLEIDPKTSEIVWEFNGGRSGAEKARFKADIISGAQRLPNGNTLVIDGPEGYMFEVTLEKKIVWDMINPYSSNTTGPWSNNVIFKARRYAPDEVRWPETLPAPIPAVSLMCSKIKDLF